MQVEEYGEQYQQEVRALLPSVGSFEPQWWRAVAGVMPVVVPALTFAAAAVCRRGVPCWPYCGLMQTTHRSTTRYRPPHRPSAAVPHQVTIHEAVLRTLKPPVTLWLPDSLFSPPPDANQTPTSHPVVLAEQ